MPQTTNVEPLTQQYGRELFAALRRRRPMPLTPQWWDERFMKWAMDDETLRVQLFRFVDVLPALQGSEDVSRHLHDYFAQARNHRRYPTCLLMRHMPADGFPGRLVARAARYNVLHLARRFIAGETVGQALSAIRNLRRRSLAFTIDLLGEAVVSESEADRYQALYLELIDGLSREITAWPPVGLIDGNDAAPVPRVNVSVKVSSLYSQFDPIAPTQTCEAVETRLRPILRKARHAGAFVNLDMESFAHKDLTLRIFRELLTEPEFRDWPDVGIAIQAYLRSCDDDLADLAEWARARGTPVWVRLVKGAYWDYETVVAAQKSWPPPVYTEKWQSDASFERQVDFLIENRRWLRPAIGSHNVRSIAHAMAVAESRGLPPHAIEFQTLYGMADPIKAVLVGLGRRVRVYTPFGPLLPGIAYLVRRLLENTANESFLRAGFIEHVPEEQLLMSPLSVATNRPQAPRAAKRRSIAPPPFANEPHTDFSREDSRAAMQAALADVGSKLGGYCPLIVGGREIRTGGAIDSWNPSHRRQLVGRCAGATAEHAESAVAAAVAAFPSWRDTPAEQRATCLFRAAAILRRRRFELAAWEVYECAKQWREADADIAESIDFCEYYGREMLPLATPRRMDVPGEENMLFYEPRGVAVIVSPWNFPMAILCGMTTAALVTGNTAIMKPAGQSPVIAARLMEVLQEAGIPPGVINYLPGQGRQIGPVLVGHRDVSIIAFTGSLEIGLGINRLAAETPPGQQHIKRVINELGGKNAIIVDADADLDEAIRGIVTSAFGYSGQKCSACSRVIVLEPIYDAVLARLTDATRSLRVGPAEDPSCFVGPVIDESARRSILRYIEQGTREARLAFAGNVGPLADEGFYVAPHIFADVPPTAVIAQEEIFGPVLVVMKARDLDEAQALANGSRYALTGGLYSRSPAAIEQFRREFRVGNLYINRGITGALVERHPFGGFKLSGVGSKAGGPDYLLQFTIPRAVSENTLRHGFAPPPHAAAETPTART